MTSASVWLGCISKAEAQNLLEPFVDVALHQIKSWNDFGDLFVAGEKEYGTNNFIGRNLLGSAVKTLFGQPDSPWKTLAWPASLNALSQDFR